ncbi:coiled-coil domain-containing protein 27 [Zonotrichia leucophrys gambelii]|uniref:coiled-coil domain-containing protein 27 n=1 Tax=Zonotrichia leucophrys gambelii TaxID=257770 RepID=UPI0003944B71|nr:coiled-coil domain-containing protein 27 isoform X2 [Zonotrichia albicollis]
MEADDSQEPELAETMGQLQQELRKAKDDHKMAIGAISSLQRQMEIQESELRKIRSEKELLQKQLREREVQLQAVSDKFCSLTEEQRQEEAVVAMVEENQNLQQVVAEQEFQLAEQNKLISELQGTISQLQAEAVSTRLHLLEQKQAQRETQRQLEALQHTELQTRVALELISSKFERYRNKIIQATFSVEGIQDPQGELTDDDVLEAMQKIFNERTEFQQMLKNKGSRTSLLSSDSSTASPARRRKSSRMEKL